MRLHTITFTVFRANFRSQARRHHYGVARAARVVVAARVPLVLMIALAPIMVVAMGRILATLLAFATPTTTAGMLRATGAVNLVVM